VNEIPPSPVTERPEAMFNASNVSRLAYILSGLLPGMLLGIFGIHNLIAGYTSRGIVQLSLSAVLVWGMGCIGLFVGVTFCISIPVSLGLLIWVIVEVCTVQVDAQGRPFAP
jgi:hypothetical protein